MGLNNNDLRRINDLVAQKNTMPLDEYIKRLSALRREILNDIVVNEEKEHFEKETVKMAYQIINTDNS